MYILSPFVSISASEASLFLSAVYSFQPPLHIASHLYCVFFSAVPTLAVPFVPIKRELYAFVPRLWHTPRFSISHFPPGAASHTRPYPTRCGRPFRAAFARELFDNLEESSAVPDFVSSSFFNNAQIGSSANQEIRWDTYLVCSHSSSIVVTLHQRTDVSEERMIVRAELRLISWLFCWEEDAQRKRTNDRPFSLNRAGNRTILMHGSTVCYDLDPGALFFLEPRIRNLWKERMHCHGDVRLVSFIGNIALAAKFSNISQRNLRDGFICKTKNLDVYNWTLIH